MLADPPLAGSRPVAETPTSRHDFGRRRALIALLILAPLLIGASVEVGAGITVARADGEAHHARDTGRYADAVAGFRDLQRREGPLYLISRGSIDAAAGNADDTLLAWAGSLARQGQVEAALALVTEVATPQRVAAVQRKRAMILVTGARAAVASGDSATAVRRLDQLQPADVPSAQRGEVAQLRLTAELGAAAQLANDHRPAEAVAALDDVVRLAPRSPQARAAAKELPRTLLAAGRLAIAEFDDPQAEALLSRLATGAPSSPEAGTARSLLAAPQPVNGTVVHHDGSPSAGPVRLAAHFVVSSRGDYATGPFYTATANDTGDFTILGVPVGGPYVLQVQRDGAWDTPVDRDSGNPAYQVTVAAVTPADLSFVTLPG